MLIPNSNAFDKITDLVIASLQKLSDISKPRFKFFSTVFELWQVRKNKAIPAGMAFKKYYVLNQLTFSRFTTIFLSFEKYFIIIT
jgi:hypothetical protein